MIKLGIIAVVMAIHVASMAGLFAVLLCFIMLLAILEKAIVAGRVVRANFIRVVTRSAIFSVIPVVVSHIIPPTTNPATGVPT